MYPFLTPDSYNHPARVEALAVVTGDTGASGARVAELNKQHAVLEERMNTKQAEYESRRNTLGINSCYRLPAT
ncbi:hypothetical protein F4X86_04215 [Candidatus Saccharibacteria bacterium]|nr:hypothetical protein [Candidatus Saccharibacteria bacterium]